MSPIQTCFSFSSDDCDDTVHEVERGVQYSNSERDRLDVKGSDGSNKANSDASSSKEY